MLRIMVYIGMIMQWYYIVISLHYHTDVDHYPEPPGSGWGDTSTVLASIACFSGVRQSCRGRNSMYPRPTKYRHRFSTFPGGSGCCNCPQTKNYSFYVHYFRNSQGYPERVLWMHSKAEKTCLQHTVYCSVRFVVHSPLPTAFLFTKRECRNF